MTIWADRALEATEYLRADYQTFVFAPHLHETYAIGVIERGGQKFRPWRSAPLVMPEGRLCVINPGVVHEGRSATDDGWQYRMFYPSVAMVNRALRDGADCGTAGAFTDHVIDDPELFAEFTTLHRASQVVEPVLERETRMIAFLRRLFRRHANSRATVPGKGQDSRTVGIVRSFLHAHFERQVSIVDLAAAAGVSETQVIRAFSAALGMPPHAYLIALRVEHAKGRLRLGSGLADTAHTCGFHDQSQLTRHFRKLTGTTPGCYRAVFARRDVV